MSDRERKKIPTYEAICSVCGARPKYKSFSKCETCIHNTGVAIDYFIRKIRRESNERQNEQEQG